MIEYKRQIASLACTLILAGYATAQGDSLRLNLGQAISLAKERNLGIQAVQLGVERARRDKRVAQARLLPNVSLNTQYGYTLKKQKVYFGSEEASNSPMSAFMPSDGIEMGQKHNLTTTLNASLPLIAPQLWASLALDELSIQKALEQVRSSEQGLTNEIRKAFTAVLWSEESLRVLRQSYTNMQANRQNIKDKYERGLVAEYDLIRMDAQLKNLKPNLIQAEQQTQLAKMKLLTLMNLNPEQKIALQETLQDYEPRLEADMLTRGDSLDFSDNPRLRDYDLNQRQLRQGLRVKQTEFYPSLSLSFNYTQNFASDYLRLDNKRRWTPHALVALSLNVPLYTGGSTRHGIASLRLQAQQLQLQRLSTEQQLSLEGRNAQSTLRYAREQYQASREAITSATKGVNIAQVRYKVGAGTLLELNDAELAQRQAELNKAQAIYNYLLALYALEDLQGK